MSSINILYLVLLLICLVLSAFFSSSETAFMSLQRIRVEQMASTRVKGAKQVAAITQRPDKFLSTVLLGNNLVNAAAAALGTTMAVAIWGQSGLLIATIAVTVVLLIFAETTPKTIAVHHAVKLSLLYVGPIMAISRLFTPFVVALSWITTRFTMVLGSKPLPRSLISEEEIRTMISVGRRDGTVEESEAKMLHRVFDFGDRPASEVMIPRPEVIAIEQGSKIADFLALYAKSPVSRVPVYQENMDNVVGILSIKDALMALSKGTAKDDSIDDLIRPAYFTPETKRISELFAEMRDNNYHMAVVVDEYGGTAGIVSLSRLVEEIVGPVGDELGAAQKDYEIIDEYTYQIDGSMRIEEVNAEMGLELPEGDYETVAGFVLNLLGRIPRQGEQLKYKGLKMVITKMRGMKIEEILLTKERHATPAN